MLKVDDLQEIKNHFFILGRNEGSCKKLTGRVGIISCFLIRGSYQFPEEIRQSYKSELRKAVTFLEDEARRYGASVSFERYSFDIYLNAHANVKDGYKNVTDFFHRDTIAEVQEYYKKSLGVDEVPFLFVVDELGRSFARSQERGGGWKNEEAVIYQRFSGKYFWKTIAHELLHQFGAEDFYFPEELTRVAEKYLKNSIMGINKYVVDDLTAYLVGWKDTISRSSYLFLVNTDWITKDYFESIRSKNR